MPIAIAFLINSLGTGGAERAVTMAATELRKRGRDVRILCLEGPREGDGTQDCQVEYLSNAGASMPNPLKLLALPILGIRLARYLARHRIPVVMSHLFRANFVNVLARLLTRSRHRAILVNHTRLSRLFTEGISGRINWALCRILYPRADLIGSVSTGGARETARLLGLPEGRSITLYDPIDTTAAELTAGPTVKSLAIAAVGRMIPLKRFHDLITAFAAIAGDFPGIELRFVGDGPERGALEHLAARLGVAKRTWFYGLTKNPAAAIAGCQVFVSTSATEGFGMAIAEALAVGVPVIAADCAYGPREILSPSTDPMGLLAQDAGMEVAQFGILFPVGSASALEQALRRMLSDEAMRCEFARRGPERAADFSVERSASAYEKLLFA